MKIEHFNLNHDISNLDFDQIKQCKPKHVSTKKPQKLTTNNTEPFKLGEIEEEILKVLSERITKTFERYYKNSLKLNFPTLESNHEKVDLSKLEIDTDLFEQSYFKYDEKNLGIELNEEFLIKANGIRNSEKFLKEKGVLNDLEKKSLAPNSKEKTKKKEGLVKWFGMEKPIMTPELRLELEALRLRHTLSGRGKEQKEQFEKPEYFQIGTVIEGATEYYSDRRKKRDRKQTFLDEIIHDQKETNYLNERFDQLTAKDKKKKKKIKK